MTAYDQPRYLLGGDQALVVELGDAIDVEVNQRVHALLAAIEAAEVSGIVDLVPSYRSLLVQYDPLSADLGELTEGLGNLVAGLDALAQGPRRTVVVPTLYGGEYGPDLGFVAEHAGLSEDEVVATHAGVDYPVYMMGFTPGFPYLGGMSESIATPRLSTPRPSIPAGAVGIAESQTGVYPTASPGGWRIIGRTPLDLFHADREPPALLAAGDSVHFAPLASEAEFADIKARVESGEFELETR